jgi:hypothetical protein
LFVNFFIAFCFGKEKKCNTFTKSHFIIKLGNMRKNYNLRAGKKWSYYLLVFIILPFFGYSQFMVPTSGNNSVSTCSGTITDNGGTSNYLDNSDGYTVINPGVPGNYVKLSGNVQLSASGDDLIIYDGVGTSGTVLWSASFYGSSFSCVSFSFPEITSQSGSLTVRFKSDASTNCSGFDLNIGCSTYPGYCIPITETSAANIYISSFKIYDGFVNSAVNTSTYNSIGYQDFSVVTPIAQIPVGHIANVLAVASGPASKGKWSAWVDWDKDGIFDEATEVVFNSTDVPLRKCNFALSVPSGQATGDYRLRIRVNNAKGIDPFTGDPATNYNGGGYLAPCENAIDDSWGITGAIYYGETEDYTIRIIADCTAKITGVTNGQNCGQGAVTLEATGSAGVTGFNWYSSQTGGSLIASTPTGVWDTPVITSTTSYWVTALDGTCESLFRTRIDAEILSTADLTITPSTPTLCGEEVLHVEASGNAFDYLVDEDFEGGGLGVFTHKNYDANGASYDAVGRFENRTSSYIPDFTPNWKPQISSGFEGDHFALAVSGYLDSNIPSGGPVIKALELTNSLNTTGFTDLTLEFDAFYFKSFPDASNSERILLQVSTNGGISYTNTVVIYNSELGSAQKFEHITVSLNAFVNRTNLKFRFYNYTYGTSGDATSPLTTGLALDNIKLYGHKPFADFEWTSVPVVDIYTDAACTVPYLSGTIVDEVYVKPTYAQLEQSNFSFTIGAILDNGCTFNQDVNVSNNTKIWKGAIGTNWSDPNNWAPVGVPTIDNCVYVPSHAIIDGTDYDAFAKNLTVSPTGDLDNLSSNTITVKEWVEVETGGSFDLENSASLIQIDNVANIGTISMKRNAFIKKLDYVYWSSPVSPFTTSAISPSTPTGFIYKWIPSISGLSGNWAAGNETMVLGKGYIVRGPNGFGAAPSMFTANFVGVPNNGNITVPISRGTYTSDPYSVCAECTLATKDDDNWNLLGNPYPSAIDADVFLSTNSTNLDQFVKIWTHGLDPSDGTDNPFYGEYGFNYSVADYITYNALGGTQFGYDGKIAAGQSFFVLMNDANSQTENVSFDNTMRSNTLRNDQFYRTSNSNRDLSSVEKHRIWLKLVDASGVSSDALVGYATGASNTFDPTFDAPAIGLKADYELYSLVDDKVLSIQGRSLPFTDQDQVPLGVVVPAQGEYTIAVSALDGVFLQESQSVYLEDKATNYIHDLKSSPYVVNLNEGRFEDRFVLRYSTALKADAHQLSTEDLLVYANDQINILASTEDIKSVTVFDVLGKKLYNKENISGKELIISTIAKTQSALIVNVVLENGYEKSYKIIF